MALQKPHFSLDKLIANKGCGFVLFSNTDSAINAYSNMAGVPLNGKPIKIGYGKPQERQERHNPEEREANATSNLWIGNIGPTVSEEQLREIFGRFGRITNVRLLSAKNCAFVNFENIDIAVQVKSEMQGYMIAGQNIKINYGKELKPSLIGKSSTPGLGYNKPQGSNRTDYYSQITDGKLVPSQAPTPSSSNLTHIIDTLVKYVSTFGQLFENKVVSNHKNDDRFRFLFGGEGSDYYKYSLYQQCVNMGSIRKSTGYLNDQGQFIQQNPSQPLSLQSITSRTLTPLEVSEFTQLLDTLVPTQLSIRVTLLLHSHLFNIYTLVLFLDVKKLDHDQA